MKVNAMTNVFETCCNQSFWAAARALSVLFVVQQCFQLISDALLLSIRSANYMLSQQGMFTNFTLLTAIINRNAVIVIVIAIIL